MKLKPVSSLIKEWPQFRESWWLTDDEDAYEYARRRNIPTYRTIDVMRHIVVEGALLVEDAYALMNAMADENRGLYIPSSIRELS